jgi:hypothetical protein
MGTPGQALALPADIGRKDFRGTNAAAYLASLPSDKEKKFYNFHSWCQCYKTFFLCC